MTDLAYLDGDSMENYKNYDSKIKDGKLCISVYDILPQNFDRIFSYSVFKEGEGTFSIPFSPMQYFFKAMKSKDGKLANLSKAMYWYWDAAKTYTMWNRWQPIWLSFKKQRIRSYSYNDDKPYSYNYSNDGCYISLNADQYAIITSYVVGSTFKYNADKTVPKSNVSGQVLKLTDLKVGISIEITNN